MSRIYFDYNATAPLRAIARKALIEALDAGNAASVHAEGRFARGLIEFGARFFGFRFGDQARTGDFRLRRNRGRRHNFAAPRREKNLLIGAGEHVCVEKGHAFSPECVEKVALDQEGRLDLKDLRDKLGKTAGTAPVLALQAVNNETGIIQPVAAAAEIVHAAGGMLVCDAVQAFGRIECSLAATGADILFLSSHKLGGPKGAGAIAFARRELLPATPLIRGGGQERSFRAGTENVAAIVGFAAAALEAERDRTAEMGRVTDLRDFLQAGLLEIAPEAAIFGREAARVGNTLAFALPGLAAETLVAAFDVEGLALSSGSACSSGKVTPSHVLAAMGVPADLARSGLRISLGWNSHREEVVRFLQILARVRERMRGRLKKPA